MNSLAAMELGLSGLLMGMVGGARVADYRSGKNCPFLIEINFLFSYSVKIKPERSFSTGGYRSIDGKFPPSVSCNNGGFDWFVK